jgi:hypothetical protein
MARKRVINVTTATRTLTRNENGSIVVLDRGAGSTVTLPVAGRGLEFQFVIKTTGSYTVICSSTDKMRGTLLMALDDTAQKNFHAVPASTVKIETNGGTTGEKGGVAGSNFTLVCDTDGMWTVSGACVSGTGAAAETTPFAA